MGQLMSHPIEPGVRAGVATRESQGRLLARKGSDTENLRRFTGVKRSTFEMLPHESEDIQITGGTRSLVRRLLALNVEGSLKKKSHGAASMVAAKIA